MSNKSSNLPTFTLKLTDQQLWIAFRKLCNILLIDNRTLINSDIIVEHRDRRVVGEQVYFNLWTGSPHDNGMGFDYIQTEIRGELIEWNKGECDKILLYLGYTALELLEIEMRREIKNA